ncbi:hypothetical protein [Nguyenibacter vanlangensis]|uniref:Uncharacterized protein n=1 Tax=Nguyenibacter vanlangensis TaxID=1216886 RepID=A0A7Y7ISV2_9PROT|nr:hypothetical protein [Nguyenibacter vanlangensis]NVN09695.1 hypothetical protein [Nguyenibacter vanlangensis]
MADETADYIRRPEFDAMREDVRDIDRQIAILKNEVSSTKADLQDLKQGLRDLLAEVKKSQSLRGIINGGWAAVGTGFALGAAKLLGLAP